MQNQTSQPETKVQESKTPKQHFGTEPKYMSIFEELDAVLGTKPSIAPTLILEGRVQLQATSILNA